MLVISMRADNPLNPFMVFDGKKLLALFRDENEVIELTYIPRKALKAIARVHEISVAEMDENSKIEHHYKVNVILDSKLKKKLKQEGKFLY